MASVLQAHTGTDDYIFFIFYMFIYTNLRSTFEKAKNVRITFQNLRVLMALSEIRTNIRFKIAMLHVNQKVYFTVYISFSGEQLDGKLTIERFLAFQSELQREILSLEFHRKSPDHQTGNF